MFVKPVVIFVVSLAAFLIVIAQHRILSIFLAVFSLVDEKQRYKRVSLKMFFSFHSG